MCERVHRTREQEWDATGESNPDAEKGGNDIVNLAGVAVVDAQEE